MGDFKDKPVAGRKTESSDKVRLGFSRALAGFILSLHRLLVMESFNELVDNQRYRLN